MRNLKIATARNISVFMTDSTDHLTGKTGLTLTIAVSKAGGAFATITPTVTERANGWYQLALTTSHTDTAGDLAFHITATGADPTDFLDQVVGYDPLAGTISLAAAGTDGIVIETGINERQAIALILATVTGTLSGAGTGTITIKGANNIVTRVLATTDTVGNRSALTLSPPA